MSTGAWCSCWLGEHAHFLLASAEADVLVNVSTACQQDLLSRLFIVCCVHMRVPASTSSGAGQ